MDLAPDAVAAVLVEGRSVRVVVASDRPLKICTARQAMVWSHQSFKVRPVRHFALPIGSQGPR